MTRLLASTPWRVRIAAAMAKTMSVIGRRLPARRVVAAAMSAAASSPSMPSPGGSGTLLIFGAGYAGEAVARRAISEGYTVYGTTRTEKRAAELEEHGVRPILFRGSEPIREQLDVLLAETTHVLSTVPPHNGVDPVLHHHAQTVCKQMPSLRWVGHFSTLSVYGNVSLGGEWIDESTEPKPCTAGARLRLLVESEWTDLPLVATPSPPEVHIFRPAQMYGPRRGAHTLLQAGDDAVAIEKDGHVASLVHIDDVAEAVLATMAAREGAEPGGDGGARTYVLADSEPAPPADVIRHAAHLLGRSPPPVVPYEREEKAMSSVARAYWAFPTRARSAAAGLGVELRYPTYREGLRASLEAEGWSEEERLSARQQAAAAAQAAALAKAEAEVKKVEAVEAIAVAKQAVAAARRGTMAAEPVTVSAEDAPRTPPKAERKKPAARQAAARAEPPSSLASAVAALEAEGWVARGASGSRIVGRAWKYASASDAGSALGRIAKIHIGDWPIITELSDRRLAVRLPAEARAEVAEAEAARRLCHVAALCEKKHKGRGAAAAIEEVDDW